MTADPHETDPAAHRTASRVTAAAPEDTATTAAPPAGGPADHAESGDSAESAGTTVPAAAAGLPADVRDAVERVCRTERLLVAMDFDGTMSPLVPRAQDARPLPDSAAAFARIARLPRTTTAMISGRALASLREVASPPEETLLIGSHGAELWLGPGGPELSLDAEAAALLAKVTDILQGIIDSHPGTVLELKPAGAVLHTRRAADPVAEEAVAQAHGRLDRLPGAYVSEGKRVLEVSVVRADKGEGLRQLREFTRATALIFAGDDVTDEHGFEALEGPDVGVKVGDGATAAPFRIDSPDQVPALLELILAARTAAVAADSPAG